MLLFKMFAVITFSVLLVLAGWNGMQETGEGFCLGVVMFLFGSLFTYMYPSWVACQRNIVSEESVVMSNILYGWTVIGWLIALYWALTDPARKIGAVARAGS